MTSIGLYVKFGQFVFWHLRLCMHSTMFSVLIFLVGKWLYCHFCHINKKLELEPRTGFEPARPWRNLITSQVQSTNCATSASTTLIKRPVVRLLAPLFIYRPPELRSHIVLSIGKSLWMIKIFRKYEMTVLLRLNYGNLGLSTSFKS